MAPRKGQEFTWASFPKRKTAAGWHCRKCGVILTGRKSSWCSRDCEKAVLKLVDWNYIRRAIRRRDKWKCVLCGARATDVDHIVELADGGCFHDPANLRSLCDSCHKVKTAASRTARAERKKAAENAVSCEEVVMTDVSKSIPSEGLPNKNFAAIQVGATFKAGGETYRKTSELTFEDVNHLEQYIDQMFDRKIGAEAKPVAGIDTSARVVKEQ